MRGIGGLIFGAALAVSLCARLLSGTHRLALNFREAPLLAVAVAPPPTTSTTTAAFRILKAPLDYNGTCGAWLNTTFNCGEEDCSDKVTGYFNYLDLLYCQLDAVGARVAVCIVMLVWVFFLLHLVESTTNYYFVTSLQLTVNILKLSPNIAGVTFLAVGNAACDVIASIAAIQADSVDVGVGTTVGAGIFVTCGERKKRKKSLYILTPPPRAKLKA
jgi:hypothetical protein